MAPSPIKSLILDHVEKAVQSQNVICLTHIVLIPGNLHWKNIMLGWKTTWTNVEEKVMDVLLNFAFQFCLAV